MRYSEERAEVIRELISNFVSVHHLEVLCNLILVEHGCRPSYLVESVDAEYAQDIGIDPEEAEKNKDILECYMPYFSEHLTTYKFDACLEDSGYLLFVVRKDCDAELLFKGLEDGLGIVGAKVLGYIEEVGGASGRIGKTSIWFLCAVLGREGDTCSTIYFCNTDRPLEDCDIYANEKEDLFLENLEYLGLSCVAKVYSEGI